MIEAVIKICGALSALAAVVVLARKLYFWRYPASAELSYQLVFDSTKADSLSVSVLNRSNAPIYVRSCKVRSTYPSLQVLWRHVRRPFLSPRLYPNLRYNGVVYQLVGNEPVRIEPAQLVKLHKEIYEHPLNAIYGPMLVAIVRLTSGRIIRSKLTPAPPVWKMIGRRGKLRCHSVAFARES